METQRAADAFSGLIEAFRDFATSLEDLAREVAYMTINAAPARWKHLALYGKTRRVRKKWLGKILRFGGGQLNEGGRRCQSSELAQKKSETGRF